jgi:hypothetical protein
MRSKLARPLIAVTVRFNIFAAMATDRPLSKIVRRRRTSSAVQTFRCSRFTVQNILGFGELNGWFERRLSFSTHGVKSRSNHLVLHRKNTARLSDRELGQLEARSRLGLGREQDRAGHDQLDAYPSTITPSHRRGWRGLGCSAGPKRFL